MLYPEPKTRVCQSAFGSIVFSLLISPFILHSSSSHLTGLEVVGSNTLRAKVWKCGLFLGSTVVCGWKKNRQQLPFSWVREEISNLDMCSKKTKFPLRLLTQFPRQSPDFSLLSTPNKLFSDTWNSFTSPYYHKQDQPSGFFFHDPYNPLTHTLWSQNYVSCKIRLYKVESAQIVSETFANSPF